MFVYRGKLSIPLCGAKQVLSNAHFLYSSLETLLHVASVRKHANPSGWLSNSRSRMLDYINNCLGGSVHSSNKPISHVDRHKTDSFTTVIISTFYSIRMSKVFIDDVNLDYFTTNVAIGENAGETFTFNAGAGNFAEGFWIHRLTFWADDQYIKGCEMVMNKRNEGNKIVFGMVGQKVGTKSETFVFGEGERLTSLKIWGTGNSGGRLSGVAWTTSENRSFEFGQVSSPPTFQPDVGCGILVGMFGQRSDPSNRYLYALGFAVLRRIKVTKLINLQYPNLQAAHISKAPMSIKSIRYDNSNGTSEQEFTFSGEMQVSQTSMWSVSAGVTVGMSYEVEAEMLFYNAKVSASVELSISRTYGSSTTNTTIESFNFPLKVAAGKTVTATATLYEANIDAPFTAEMMMVFDTGVNIKYNVEGVYRGVDSDRVEVFIEEEGNGKHGKGKKK